VSANRTAVQLDRMGCHRKPSPSCAETPRDPRKVSLCKKLQNVDYLYIASGVAMVLLLYLYNAVRSLRVREVCCQRIKSRGSQWRRQKFKKFRKEPNV